MDLTDKTDYQTKGLTRPSKQLPEPAAAKPGRLARQTLFLSEFYPHLPQWGLNYYD